MAKIIAVTNQKGGVGKTTTATSLAAGLVQKGYTSLLVDTDPQGNATDTYGVDAENGPTIFDVFVGEAAVTEAIQRQEGFGDIVSGDLRMSAADMQFTQQGREYILREALTPVLPAYDFVIVDTPPTLGIVTINALTAANSIIIPMLADRYSLQGIKQLAGTVNTVRKYSNPNLKIDGILLTRYNGRTILNRDVREAIETMVENWETKVFQTAIRQSVSLQESQTQQESIFDYAPDSTTGKDYMDFIQEYIGR
ncbi:AAA family ATPase [Ruminococcaceae bacterium OttesenSCG-928-L11]|nr:AAA family ATPase [Ruminococcaceae bacterium OttesenSCG-928-L11]